MGHGIGVGMNDTQFVTEAAQVASEAKDCGRCRYPVLCARHVVASIGVRRARVSALMRG